MKIILEPSDFPAHVGRDLEARVAKALDYGFTIEATKFMDGHTAAMFHNVGRGASYRLVGPVDVELVTTPAKRETRAERTLH